jgi:hypothetical protein
VNWVTFWWRGLAGWSPTTLHARAPCAHTRTHTYSKRRIALLPLFFFYLSQPHARQQGGRSLRAPRPFESVSHRAHSAAAAPPFSPARRAAIPCVWLSRIHFRARGAPIINSSSRQR